MTRVYRDAYERTGTAAGLVDDAAARAEADEEFADEDVDLAHGDGGEG